MKYKFILPFLLILSTITIVSSYTIICTEGERGVQIWNLGKSFNETGLKLEDIEKEEGFSCTIIETSTTLRDDCKEFGPIISQLNQRLADNHEEIETSKEKLIRYNYYKVFSFIFFILTIILTIFLKLNQREDKYNGRKTKKTKR